MRYLYKYPQAPFPYADLVETNRRRSRADLEYELIDTGVFDDDSYFDVFVEYAKAGPEDLVDRDHGLQPRPRAGDASPPADALVPKHLAAGQSRSGQVIRVAGRPRRGAGSHRAGSWANTCCAARAARSCCSSTTRPIRSAGGRTGESNRGERALFFKDGINDYLIGRREEDDQPAAASAPRPPRATRSTSRRAGTPRCACA